MSLVSEPSCLAVLALAALSTPLHAQTPQSLPAVSVVGNREPTAVDRVVADVVVIDAQRIRDTSADSLEDLLAREGGIQLSRNGGPGQSASVRLRGNAASSVVVLLDGVRIGSATLGQTDLAGIALAQVERIEILRGPGSSLFGADAVGGVVNIVTRRAANGTRSWAHLAAGSLASSEADAGVSARLGALDLGATLSREASDGRTAVEPGDRFGVHNPDRDGFARRSASLRAGFTPAEGHRIGASVSATKLNAQYDGAQFLAPAFLADATPDFRNRFDTRVAALDYRGTIAPDWTTTLAASTQRDDLRSGADVVSRYITHRRDLTWQNAWAIAPERTVVVAVEHLNEAVDTSDFASPPARRTNALVLGYTGRYGAQRVQADVRHDDSSSDGGHTTGKLGWSLEWAPGLTLRAVAGTAFRAPTFNDLYYPGYGIPSGPLQPRPERARSLELGLQWRQGDAQAGFTVYRNQVRDLIGYQADRSRCPADPAYDFGCAGNTARARMLGATLTGAQRVGEFSMRASIDLLDARDADTGERLVRRAAHQEALALDWTRGAWTAAGALTAVGARPEGGKTLPSYQSVDLQAFWRFAPNWRAEVKLQNVLDRRYEAALDSRAVGRVAWLGLRWDSEGF